MLGCACVCISMEASSSDGFKSVSLFSNRSTCDQLNKVIEQLEQERGVASKRARRLQDELQRVQQVYI